MAEKYYDINPYIYCNGDPVNLVDPEGMDTWNINVSRKKRTKKENYRKTGG